MYERGRENMDHKKLNKNMKKLLLIIGLIVCSSINAQTTLTLGRIDTIWSTGQVPRGANNTNTWYTLYNRSTPAATTTWSLTGNSGTTAGTNFLGTTDDQPLVFKTNATENMRLLTNGNLGIGTTSPTNALSFGNAANKTIWIENTDWTTAGRNLSLQAGSTVITSSVTPAFTALSQGSLSWAYMCVSTMGNVYVGVIGGNIYMQTAGAGNFVSLGQTVRNWRGMAAAPNGNVYCAARSGDIYMQTAGTGNFVALGQTSRLWAGMAAAPNGNIYAATESGDIYMQTAGTGNFVALGQASRAWQGMTAASNGNIYAGVDGGDIYMQTAGIGNFVALSQTTRRWYGLAAAPNGNVYAAVFAGDIYMQTAGTGNFVALGQTTRNWIGMAADANGNVYAANNAQDIYEQINTAGGTANLSGGSLTLSSGQSKGTGSSSIIFQTATTSTLSGAFLNPFTTKMIILGNGNVGIGTASPSILLQVGQVGSSATLGVSGKIGIGTTSPTNALSFGNAAAQKVWIENTDSVNAGRGLTIQAGSTVATNTVNTTFNALGQSTLSWRGMAAAPNGNVYASVTGGDIYMQTAGVGTFNALSQTTRNWVGMCATPSGNIYAAVTSGDIYMQTSGIGNFIALGGISRSWTGMAASPSGNVYAAVSGGDIYKQTAGVGSFVALSAGNRAWQSITVAPNGDVYAAVLGGDIYKQTAGVGSFVALSQASLQWFGMTATPNGNIYAAVNVGDIYMQTNGTGNFIALGGASRQWRNMAASVNGNVYAPTNGGDIYEQIGAGSTDLSGGNLTLSSGQSKGTGASSIVFQTSSTDNTSSGALNPFTTKMIVLGGGNVGIGTTTPTAMLQVGQTGGNGSFKYVDGNQGAHKFLTSDSSGNANWEAVVTTLVANQIAFGSITNTITGSSNLTYSSGILQYVDGNQGSGKVLTSDASGNATWQYPPSPPVTVFTPTVGETVTVLNKSVNIIYPSGTIATLTLQFPDSPSDGDYVDITFDQIVTSTTYNSGTGGATINGQINGVVGGQKRFYYVGGTNAWY